MAKKTKCYSLSEKAIKHVQKVQIEHRFSSESAALEYILNYQLNENKVKELVYEILIKVLSENSIAFNPNSVQNAITVKVNDEVEQAILDAADNIFDSMPD